MAMGQVSISEMVERVMWELVTEISTPNAGLQPAHLQCAGNNEFYDFTG